MKVAEVGVPWVPPAPAHARLSTPALGWQLLTGRAWLWAVSCQEAEGLLRAIEGHGFLRHC